MFRKVFLVSLSFILVLGLMPYTAFAKSNYDRVSQTNSHDGFLSSHPISSSYFRDGEFSGKWGTCDWNWDAAKQTVTVYPGNAGTVREAPWKYDQLSAYNPNKEPIHIVFIEDNGEKVVFPKDCTLLFSGDPLSEATIPIASIDFSGVDTSQVTNMSTMFLNCSSITSLDLTSFNGTAVKNFTINPIDISTATISGIESKVYTGQEITQTIVVKNGEQTLQEGVDYSISYKNNILPGAASIIVKGEGVYGGTVTNYFYISYKDFTSVEISGIEDTTYTGYEITMPLVVKDGEMILREGADYEVRYEDNIYPGMATITIIGMGGYDGVIERTFEIFSKDIKKVTVDGIFDRAYTGEEITQSPILIDGDIILQENEDYELSYVNNVDPGSARVIITGKRGYSGTAIRVFVISIRDINVATVQGIVDKVYSGQEITQSLKVLDGDFFLEENVDYELRYEDNINAGTAKVTIIGKRGYFNSCTKTFTIAPKDIKGLSFSDIVNKKYTGKAQTQDLVVKDGSVVLRNSQDYTLSYTNNINAGTAKLVIKGTGNYSGSVSRTFTITPVSIKNAALKLSKTSFTYNGKVQRPTIKTIGGKALAKDKDYTLKYSSSKNPGTYKLYAIGKNNYAGTTKVASYKITKAPNTLKVKAVRVINASSKKDTRSAVSKAVKIMGAKGTLSFKKTGGNKNIIVGTNGAIKIKKGLKKGTYKIKVAVTAKGSTLYDPLTKSAVITIKIQ